MPDITSLDRFVEAQALAYPTALAEIRRGAKRTHWMWFIFPQIAGLGQSATAQHFAKAGRMSKAEEGKIDKKADAVIKKT